MFKDNRNYVSLFSKCINCYQLFSKLLHIAFLANISAPALRYYAMTINGSSNYCESILLITYVVQIKEETRQLQIYAEMAVATDLAVLLRLLTLKNLFSKKGKKLNKYKQFR